MEKKVAFSNENGYVWTEPEWDERSRNLEHFLWKNNNCMSAHEILEQILKAGVIMQFLTPPYMCYKKVFYCQRHDYYF